MESNYKHSGITAAIIGAFYAVCNTLDNSRKGSLLDKRVRNQRPSAKISVLFMMKDTEEA